MNAENAQGHDELLLGIDVGSTTVKATALSANEEILWQDYRRHNARQAEVFLDFLERLNEALPRKRFQIYITGSGGRGLARYLDVQYIQEVNSVAWAMEALHPRAKSVIELGGQDAKVIIRREDAQGRSRTLTFMNDKCAGGTGATIDRIFGKFGLTTEEAASISMHNRTIHHISAKCGVFSETDVVGLLKSGIDREDIFVSLCVAIAKQNLEVLVRGNVLSEEVLLLGGPHAFFGAFSEIWRELIPETWKAHAWTPKSGKPLDELIYVPDHAQYFAALGAALFGSESRQISWDGAPPGVDSRYLTDYIDTLQSYLEQGRLEKLKSFGAVRPGLVQSPEEAKECIEKYSPSAFRVPLFEPGQTYRAFVGIDGGSTSTKLVIVDDTGEPIYRDYVLSRGNPIVDVRKMFASVKAWTKEAGIHLDIVSTGVTGYAADILSTAFNLDVSIVETVAHMKAATETYGDVDVICDVGGQDIKILFSKHGRVVHFKINTQCSAGNGYFLQAMAEQFGHTVDEYTEAAFRARQTPVFNVGCAVFMEQDRVNFQQQGWSKDEIMAGLAKVLPMNIWHYVVQDTNIAKFGRTFVLQGGTQRNLAAVKAQVDYIKDKVPDARVILHKHADICGAIGAALEARARANSSSTFIGLDSASEISFTATSDETTRCRFCSNRCPRTFVDIDSGAGRNVRYISGWRCEKGMSLDRDEMREKQRANDALRDRYPNLVELASELVFAPTSKVPLPTDGSTLSPEVQRFTKRLIRPGFLQKKRFERSNESARRRRSRMVVGLPRLLNLYYFGPFFDAYLRTLGVGEILWSDYTSDKLWQAGNKWGSIDPCFPAKVAPAHVYNLIHQKKATHICFPIVTYLPSQVEPTLANAACVIQMGTPEVVEAAFTRDNDTFAEQNVTYWKPLLRLDRPRETVGRLFEYFGQRLDITEHENAFAVLQGFKAMDRYLSQLRDAGRRALDWLVANDKLGVLVVGHPYHHDPGLNHGIPEQFRLLGFPVFAIESLPIDDDFLGPLFSEEEETEADRFDIRDIWWRNFNRNTNHKIWAAKVASKHPNLAVIDLSSFKCGHDAPTYSYIDNILDATETPHFLFHDLDQNRPSATHAIRVQTIQYFLIHEERRLRNTTRKKGR